jgi:hypothetical protein
MNAMRVVALAIPFSLDRRDRVAALQTGQIELMTLRFVVVRSRLRRIEQARLRYPAKPS